MTLDPKRTVSEIAREHPEVMNVFEKHRIDLCCGGKLALETVALKHGLDLKQLVRELEAVIPSPR